MKRWFTRILRRCGIDLPFPDLVCPQHEKAIRVMEDGRIEVIDRRSLVFLSLPEAGELRDVVPMEGGADSVPYISPDALEVRRRSTRQGTEIHWIPREPIVRYALYPHQHGWISSGGSSDAALYTEFSCDMKTGTFALELVTTGRFEAAVAFKRPRWRRLARERSLVRYALGQLESNGEQPAIVDEGTRLEWKLAGPKVGDRWVCVAFQENGVELWRQRLEARSLGARMRRLIRPLASA